MVEVGQHDVVAAGGYLGIEGDGALQAGVGMDETGEAGLPRRVGEAWHVEGAWDARERGGDQARLVSKVERDVDHGLDVGGREVEITPGFVELVGVAAGELADVLLEAEQALDGLVFALSARCIQAAALAQHCLLHLLGDDRSDFA